MFKRFREFWYSQELKFNILRELKEFYRNLKLLFFIITP